MCGCRLDREWRLKDGSRAGTGTAAPGDTEDGRAGAGMQSGAGTKNGMREMSKWRVSAESMECRE